MTFKVGTGLINPFLSIQNNGQEQGFNTDGSFTYDQTRSNFTNPLPMNQVPTVKLTGDPTPYREFILDANEANSGIDAQFSIDTFRVYLCDDTNAKTYTTYSQFTANSNCKEAYNVDHTLLATDGKTNGSGNSLDYQILIPETNFSGSGLSASKYAACAYNPSAADCGVYIILWTHMGGLGGAWVTGSTFEEFSTIKRPYVTVTKTANPTFTRTYKWTITKSVTPTDITLFSGQSDTATFSISVAPASPAYVDGSYSLTGAVTVANPTAASVLVKSIVDTLPGYGPVALTCPGGVSTNVTIAAGGTYVCTYSITSSPTPATQTNTATVLVDVGTGYDGSVFTGSAQFTWGAPTTEVDKNPPIYDKYDGDTERLLGNFSSLTFPVTYKKGYTCAAAAGSYTNIARVDITTGTDPADTATTNVHCLSLTVTKTAATSLTRTYKWLISKAVSPASWNLFNGDQGTSAYTVTATPNGYDDATWAVAGSITIANPNTVPVYITGVGDTISTGLAASAPSCGVTFPYTLPASTSLVCTYSRSLPDGTNRTNTATAQAKPTSTGAVKAFTGQATVDFSGVSLTEINKTVHVVDKYQTAADTALGSATGSSATNFNYNRTFACGGDAGTHTNVARITETGQADTASVSVTCNVLTVAKTAAPKYQRKWNWSIAKSTDSTSLTLAIGQTYIVNYKVKIDTTNHVDSNWRVDGTITVSNPATIAATINSVTDLISGGVGAAAVTCPAASFPTPYTLAAGGSLACTYTKALAGTTSLTNTATATRQAYSYTSALVQSNNGTVTYSNPSPVAITFGAPTEKVDECVNVSDTNTGTTVTGKWCVGDLPKTFTYTKSLNYGTCGPDTIPNTASFVTAAGTGATSNTSTGATGSSSVTILVNVPCPAGCTLTPGYWKTHNVSFWGGAPHDSTWLKLPAAENTGFFTTWAPFYPMAGPDTSSTFTWFNVMWTPPKGNPYYNLSFQYAAAKLNLLNNAGTTSAVTAAITWAETFFAANTPDSSQVKLQKANLIYYAGVLGSYNSGLTGPGHCSEDGTSAP